ncbi:hypothetical protein ACK8HY_01400 [Sphingobacterium sp. NGMCC 1.201703]|uniref:hypothetical protein n=1 Tax=Sphingobacterium sp. NGMCC 1.201703 TaxID=3388657 RepID=UPI0039FC151F
MRNRNTIELLGFWKSIQNPNSKPLEFEGFRKQAGLNSFVMPPGLTTKEWRDSNPDKKGNIRDYTNIEPLVVLSNMESINALLIQQGLSQNERLKQLNKLATTQMRSLIENKAVKKLK